MDDITFANFSIWFLLFLVPYHLVKWPNYQVQFHFIYKIYYIVSKIYTAKVESFSSLRNMEFEIYLHGSSITHGLCVPSIWCGWPTVGHTHDGAYNIAHIGEQIIRRFDKLWNYPWTGRISSWNAWRVFHHSCRGHNWPTRSSHQ